MKTISKKVREKLNEYEPSPPVWDEARESYKFRAKIGVWELKFPTFDSAIAHAKMYACDSVWQGKQLIAFSHTDKGITRFLAPDRNNNHD